MGRLLAATIGLSLVAGAAAAQSSASYTIEQHLINAGGHPADGARPSSASFRISADAVGEDIVELNVDADLGAVRPGDLLVCSTTPGHAMRAWAEIPGTVIGKALEPLESGRRAIRVLVMPR